MPDWSSVATQNGGLVPRSAVALHSQSLVFLAVLAEGRGVPTARIARRANLSVSTTHHHLKALKRAGLVDYDEGRHGTIRPAVRAVPFGGNDAG